MVKTIITMDPIKSVPENDTHTNDGAELVFHGRVRDTENDEIIVSLDYEHYPEMAEKELQILGEKTVRKFPISELYCIHRVGEIPIGHLSMQVIIWSPHRLEAIEAMTWFISTLKRDVPIWKHAVFADGRRIPSKCDHDH
ncbi:MAG: molybdenum cofactor biosynthesis protein MoaE [Candidatus Marinimicrobia bacterium]|jgi:molybdopterin synthase catalytic subunit|nr:molybdenum cofactor biosynthesis protein MoaE [Candidatus Neomarinimicrobiota bacterium]MBT3633824.1 molybdenum cofactor biosynthesis protein MoaE [Candidatus Neomarinimicrobiota bacterium]MBT3682616.1 molybdenum cofactor biosynthesis protein MoaE [Candidatus Neomarinimicrobiota bacterium]MBT3759380.1 molybdenum cofactor biosynthesis protein MoaE [Candidatus Neomarinimicrobiota bacterium]MBT3894612.1 molybdenum cofactor biosynthesis protein MoaE [Candidatus Neomarinimicrobiota bacterium]